jgi:hypothetical protein
MPKTGFLARWNVQVRSNPQLAALQAPGMARSYPMLAAEDGRLLACHFYHVADQVGRNQLQGPPLGYVLLIMTTESDRRLPRKVSSRLKRRPTSCHRSASRRSGRMCAV